MPSPLIPEGEGLPSQDFWHCVKARIGLAVVLMNVDNVRAEVMQRTATIEDLKKKMYAVYLYDQKNRASAELDRMQRSPAKERFIATMKALNLSIRKEADSSETE